MNELFGPGKIDSAWFGLAGVVVGGLLTFCKDLALERFKNKAAGRYFGLLLVQKIDTFADDCLKAALDDGYDDYGDPTNYNEKFCEPTVPMPKMELDSANPSWKAIDHNLIYDIVNLNIDAEQVEKLVGEHARSKSIHSDFSDSMMVRMRTYAGLGMKAYRISNRLRKAIGVPVRTSRFGQLDVDQQLRDIEQDMAKRLAKLDCL